MDRNEFFAIFLEEMDFYGEYTIDDITPETELHRFSNWDSLSRATVYNICDNYLGVKLDHNELRRCLYIGDIMKLAGVV